MLQETEVEFRPQVNDELSSLVYNSQKVPYPDTSMSFVLNLVVRVQLWLSFCFQPLERPCTVWQSQAVLKFWTHPNHVIINVCYFKLTSLCDLFCTNRRQKFLKLLALRNTFQLCGLNRPNLTIKCTEWSFEVESCSSGDRWVGPGSSLLSRNTL